MARLGGEHRQKCKLCSPVAVAKRVDRIQRCEKMRGLRREGFRGQTAHVTIGFQRGKGRIHLRCDMFRVAKYALVLGYSQRAEASRPRINVLKKMMMNGPIMTDAEAAGGERLLSPLRRDRRLEAVEVGLIADAGDVFEDAGIGIAIGIGRRVVHVRGQADDLAYPLMIARRRSSAERPS